MPISMTRFSINSILWFGKDMEEIGGAVPGDDEEFMSCIYPTHLGKSNCWNTNALVSHFAFYTQRAYLDEKGILEKYGSFLKDQWQTGSIENDVYQNIIEAMLYVDENAEQLPEAPYTQIINKEKNKIKTFIKSLYPICLTQKIHVKHREGHKYIIE
jgi:hypothetical protein